MPGDSSRPLHRTDRHTISMSRMHHNDRMNATRTTHRQRQRQEVIAQRRPHNVDYEDAAGETPAAKTAVYSRGPAPAEAVPERPVTAAKRRPAPVVSRRPYIARARSPDPAPVAVRVEACIHCNRWLPHLTLPGNVVPAPVSIQIRPAVALGSFETVTCRGPAGCFIC